MIAFDNSTSIASPVSLLGPIHLLWMFGTDVISIAGIIGYVAVIWAIIKHKNTVCKSSFFTLTVSMGLSDLGDLIIHMVYVNPAFLVGEQALPAWYSFLWSNLWQWLNNASTVHIPFIALNRLLAVYRWQSYETYFTTPRLVLIIGYCYTYSLVSAIVLRVCTCVTSVPSHGFALTCDPNVTCAEHMVLSQKIEDGIEIVSTIILNVATFERVRRLGQQVSSSDQVKKEKNLALQFSLVCLAFTAFIAVFWVVNKWGGDLDKAASEWLISYTFLVHCALDPFLLMTLSSDIKQLLFGRWSTQVQPVTHTVSSRHRGAADSTI